MQINRFTLVIMILLIVSFTFSIKSNENETKKVYSKVEMQWRDTSLNIKLTIFNNNKFKIYIPLYRWNIYGDAVSNYTWSYSEQESWVNEILFFPSSFSDISYYVSSNFTYSGGGFPKFFIIKPKDFLLVNIKINNFYGIMEKDSNYRFQITTPYTKYKKLEKAIKYLKLKINEIIINKSPDTLNIFCLKPVIESKRSNTDDFWYPTNYKDFASKHILTEKEADSVQHILYRIDTIHCEKVLMKKNN